MKSFILIALGLAISGSCFGQKLTSDKVPTGISKSFSTQYPNANANWERFGENYTASYRLNNENYNAIYSSNGTWVGTGMEIKNAAIPTSVSSSMNRDYAAYQVKDAMRMQNADGTISYRTHVIKDGTGMELMYNEQGKLLSKGNWIHNDAPGKY